MLHVRPGDFSLRVGERQWTHNRSTTYIKIPTYGGAVLNTFLIQIVEIKFTNDTTNEIRRNINIRDVNEIRKTLNYSCTYKV